MPGKIAAQESNAAPEIIDKIPESGDSLCHRRKVLLTTRKRVCVRGLIERSARSVIALPHLNGWFSYISAALSRAPARRR